MDILKGLNDAQKEAVELADGPLLILAGAGSGKTKTLTHRIANLVANHGVQPGEILAVTFTNKAAGEMRERLAHLLGVVNATRSFMPYMGTFHSICVRILKIEADNITRVPKNFVIYDDDDRQSLIKRAMKDLSVDDKQLKPRAVSSMISKAKNDAIGPDDFAAAATHPVGKAVAQLYARYEHDRRDAGALDFDDLLLEAVHMFEDHPEIRQRWQERFKHILIDEYQDTNAVQYKMVKLLVGPSKNICVVGDDWQSIYSWRGADFTNILNFEKDFPGAKVIKLEQNYRSTQSILDAAHKVISKNKNRTDKKLWTAIDCGEQVQVTRLNDETEEAALVAGRILQRVSAKVRKFSDFAILYRVNAQSYAFERAFMQAHVPYRLVGGVRFYDRREVKDIIAYLRLLYQPNDLVSFNRIVNVPARGVGAASLTKFGDFWAGSDANIVEALIAADENSGLTARARQNLNDLGNLLYLLRDKVENGTATPGEIVDELVKAIHYKEYLNDDTPQAEDRLENLGALVSEAAHYDSLDEFLNDVALLTSADESADDEDKVTLMTLHVAKGLEFPVVFVVGLEEGLLPHARVNDFAGDDGELEEERRLLYVGMTRAKEELILTHANSRFVYGKRQYAMPSRFIDDLQNSSFAGPAPASTFDEFDIQPYEVGDRVKSMQFGIGEVVDVDGLAVRVNFDNGTTKLLNVQYARLEKL
ncbi:MAG: UvrD-helicase domain-containing protein [Candidatus Nomurabacteria bacterium]|jgi:DNA helicase-2/ATP-dependent DNA helicase PcrA|nr:UvrD-helicase domain-containing protein [Candidatus Nomurabacteria bacterium]